jgi:hypothetical protein
MSRRSCGPANLVPAAEEEGSGELPVLLLPLPLLPPTARDGGVQLPPPDCPRAAAADCIAA